MAWHVCNSNSVLDLLKGRDGIKLQIIYVWIDYRAFLLAKLKITDTSSLKRTSCLDWLLGGFFTISIKVV